MGDEKMEKSQIGRNDPCSCGSGKKYKKCCLITNGKKNEEEIKNIGKLPLYKTLITDSKGSKVVMISRERSDGNIAFVSILIDEWKMGLKDCFGSYNTPKSMLMREINSDHLPFIEGNFEECKKLIKRGVLIAEEIGTKIPEEFEGFRKIIGDLDNVELTGSLYKCFECGEGDLPEEVIKVIKKTTIEDMKRGICGKEGEIVLHAICDACKEKGNESEDVWDPWGDDSVM